MLNWVTVGGNKRKAVENVISASSSIEKKARTGNEFVSLEEAREILYENDNDWKKGYTCSSKGSRDNFDWCYYKNEMCNSKGGFMNSKYLQCKYLFALLTHMYYYVVVVCMKNV